MDFEMAWVFIMEGDRFVIRKFHSILVTDNFEREKKGGGLGFLVFLPK